MLLVTPIPTCVAGSAGLASVDSLHHHSHGHFGDQEAIRLLTAANETLAIWGDELDFGELADDIAIEARLALALTVEIGELEERIAVMYRALDPDGILRSVPGVGAINAAQILGRLGDPGRFRSLAGVRSFSGLVPSLDSSGQNGRHGGPTKSGDALLREALFMSADAARKIDPTLAQRYHRLMTVAGKHHNSALCHVSAVLLTRITSCWKSQEPYVIRDIDGTVITPEQGRRIIHANYHGLRRRPRAAQNHQEERGDGPAKQGVAERSVDRPVQIRD